MPGFLSLPVLLALITVCVREGGCVASLVFFVATSRVSAALLLVLLVGVLFISVFCLADKFLAFRSVRFFSVGTRHVFH